MQKFLCRKNYHDFFSKVVIGLVLKYEFGDGTKALSKSVAIVVVLLICIYVAAFAWSWGPLGWLVPSEIQPLETRATGQAITVAFNFLFSFCIGQAFLSMMCHLRLVHSKELWISELK